MEKLHNICRWRREAPADSTYWMEDATKFYNKVPKKMKPEHGCDRDYGENRCRIIYLVDRIRVIR